VNIIIQLRDQLIKCPLLGFHAGFLGGFDSTDDSGKLTDLNYTLIEVVLVLFLDLKLELSKRVVDLAVQIYHVTHVLEVLIHIVKMAGLLNELIDIFNLL
jgi:hypothetical protein